jgi:hypothetical protein
MNKVPKVSLSLIALLLALAASQAAKADIVFTLGNNPQPGEENVLLNNGTMGSLVQGSTNQSHTLVDFDSLTQTLFEPETGQARIETIDASGAQVPESDVSSIRLHSGANYSDLIFNTHIGEGIGSPGDTETVTVTDNLGMLHIFTFTEGNGENFLTIVATNGESIESTAISYPDGYTDLRQVRISLSPSPEPASLVLAGTGLVVVLLAAARCRRSRSRQAA